ncbi:MAG TPA: DUF2520 domain-containing protein [Flavobacteriales bacterium]|nr:DUF2520 domain-containing protein [Flavobacteriales bacterium]
MNTSIKTISILGAGNVGTFFAGSLYNLGYAIHSVYSRNYDDAFLLAKRVGARAARNVKELDNNSDLYIIAIKDDSISELVKNLQVKNGLVVHTSGSIEMDVLDSISNRIGVLYPLQTFSKGMDLKTKGFPICIETKQPEDYTLLKELSERLAGVGQAYPIDSKQRKALHLGAVFVCNFTNYLYSIAEDLMKINELPLELLHPLIIETVNKSTINLPSLNQTGPAKRNDIKVMKQHLELLNSNTGYKEIYKVISEAIINKYNK